MTAASASTRCRCRPASLAWMGHSSREHYKPEPQERCGATIRSPKATFAASAQGDGDAIATDACARDDAARMLARRWSARKRAPRQDDAARGRGADAVRVAAGRRPTAAASGARRPPCRATPQRPRRRRGPAAAAPRPLPPVESLTIDSDFSAFLQPEVDETLKRAALKQAVPRSAFQRDGRSRRLHRRLFASPIRSPRTIAASWCRAATSSIRASAARGGASARRGRRPKTCRPERADATRARAAGSAALSPRGAGRRKADRTCAGRRTPPPARADAARSSARNRRRRRRSSQRADRMSRAGRAER